jgi:DNA-directed RNA polymerase subunit H (RpoH/RPB5)
MRHTLTEWVSKQATGTLEQMLNDRGFSNIEIIGSHETFISGGILIQATGPNSKCDVICIPEKIGVKTLRSIEEEYNGRNVIVVTLHKPTPPCLRQLTKTGSWCCIFDIGFLVRNVTRHEMVPKHTIANAKEIAWMRQRWRVDDLRRLPMIRSNDPIARYLGCNIGDVVRISGSEGSQVGGCVRYCLVTKSA